MFELLCLLSLTLLTMNKYVVIEVEVIAIFIVGGYHHQVISFGLVEVDPDSVPAVLSRLCLHSCISSLTLSGKLR